jgi:hypothetical protein
LVNASGILFRFDSSAPRKMPMSSPRTVPEFFSYHWRQHTEAMSKTSSNGPALSE